MNTRSYTPELFDIREEGSIRSAQAILPHVNGLLHPASVVDVGCGRGCWLYVWQQLGIENVVGLDGADVEPEMLRIPLEKFVVCDLEAPPDLGRRFDLAMSVEVAEHLPPEGAESFVNFLTNPFDLVMAGQVLEHVLYPDRAVVSVHRMLRPNGLFIVDTPFLLKIHPCPLDLYRWTEQGMRTLLETGGFRVVQSGSWGNRRCLLKDMAAGMEWTAYNPLIHSLKNEPQFPIVVWVFARK
jgi:SAM-dependent methyltransferase